MYLLLASLRWTCVLLRHIYYAYAYPIDSLRYHGKGNGIGYDELKHGKGLDKIR